MILNGLKVTLRINLSGNIKKTPLILGSDYTAKEWVAQGRDRVDAQVNMHMNKPRGYYSVVQVEDAGAYDVSTGQLTDGYYKLFPSHEYKNAKAMAKIQHWYMLGVPESQGTNGNSFIVFRDENEVPPYLKSYILKNRSRWEK